MPDPAGLLELARLLLSINAPRPASDVQIRRSMSTAYYAVFHMVAQAGAERFMGTAIQSRAGYGLLYRSFNHGRMKSVCESLNVARLNRTLQQQLGRTAVSPEMRSFVDAFPALQAARHLADYDPAVTFVLSDAVDLVDAAAAARWLPSAIPYLTKEPTSSR